MRIAKVVAVVAGLLGFVLAIATPLLPVQQTTAQIDWPQRASSGQQSSGQGASDPVRSVIAPLVGYVPVDLEMSVPCSAAALVTAQGQSVLVSTTPKDADKAVERGLFVRLSGRSSDALDTRSVEVVVRNIPLVSATVAQMREQGCRSIEVRATSDEVTAEFVGMTGSDGKPLQGETSDGDQRPQLTGVYSDLTVPQSQVSGLRVHATVDSRYATAATPLKWVAIGVGVAMTLVSLGALAVLDGTDGRRHRRIFPARWWRLNPRDIVVIAGLAVWHIVGANTSDDGYLLTMARVAENAHYTANYYRWFGAPEAPFGWYYSVFGWLTHISTASPLVRLPALLCGIAVWLIVSHEILPRLGRAATTTAIVPWTAAVVFLASWFPFNNGLRPEPIICLGALLTWCSVERAIATGRILPAAVACTLGAFSLAAGPTGLMAVAALVAGGRPMIMSILKRSRVIRGDGNRWTALLALLAPVLAAGTFVVFVVFSNLTLTGFLQASKMKTALGPSLHWYNEINRYSSLFAFSADGSVGRRFAVLMMLVGLVVSGAMLFRKNRIPGTAMGPTRRIVGITFASLVFLMFTPTKWTHHFGVFAGLAAALAAIAAIAVTRQAMTSRRNRMLVTALVLFVTGLTFTGPNAYYYISNWGMPYGTQPVKIVVALGSVLLYLSFAALAAAGWFHLRTPYVGVAGAGTSESSTRRPVRVGSTVARRAGAAPIAIVAAAIVTFELVTAVLSGVNQSGSFSVPSSNVDALLGQHCAMADKVLVEPDPSAGLLTPVDPSLRTPLAGSGVATGGSGTDETDGSDKPKPSVTTGFTPNGLPMSLDSEASEQSLGVLATNVTASSDILTSSSGGTGGGETDRAGVNGSFAKLPFGLDPARTPVLGSYSQNDQVPSSLTSAWYRLPSKSPDRPFIALAAAGSFDITDLELQYTTGTSGRDGELTAAGSVGMIDPGPSPSWRNLRIYRSSLPADATAVRIVAVDDNLASDRFMVLSPPRVPQVQTLQSLVGTSDPVQIDWTSGLAFPCQRPFDLRDGVAEVPRWRIMPGADLSAAVSAWMDASGGGPLGWIEVALDSTTVPSYLQDDIGRDWGSLIRYTPFADSVQPARLELSTATRSGLWSPAPIRY
ncbi:arabinosyltransferase domain-containing protein [Williamsia deligens]|uniref:Arabinosyltransferase domain-containing protein n=1 Tax=Williamsia deligens TaxID=321325 RepID=A0ABW3G447_9NOCA|nr:arabinosyltransferase domain-containing protein [Williamsia deligens]MCP2193977.1 arabinosyltransferase C [Williamsia deligens]